MKKMLSISGCASLYSVIRAFVMSFTAQSGFKGSIILPMINIFRLNEEKQALIEKNRSKSPPRNKYLKSKVQHLMSQKQRCEACSLTILSIIFSAIACLPWRRCFRRSAEGFKVLRPADFRSIFCPTRSTGTGAASQTVSATAPPVPQYLCSSAVTVARCPAPRVMISVNRRGRDIDCRADIWFSTVRRRQALRIPAVGRDDGCVRFFQLNAFSYFKIGRSSKPQHRQHPNLKYAGPSSLIAARTAFAASTASAGLITVMPGIVRISAISSQHWWVAPSSPTETPAWVAPILTGRWGYPIEFRTCSKARPAANIANVEANTF